MCGNFGCILLHGAWIDETDGQGGSRGKSVLAIIEKMIEVTMMRGAQSGGVVTYQSSSANDKSDSLCMTPSRARVVKTKRGDLSKILRSKIEKKLMSKSSLFSTSSSSLLRKKIQEKRVQFFSGHTRFATSSMATLDGTHPHQWTCQNYSVYDMERLDKDDSDFVENAKAVKVVAPRTIPVENFITHNGDFEFFSINGKKYEVDTIQEWLEFATATKMKTTVDSAAIAGMIDIIRTKGCFALSARYAICLGMSTSKIEDDVKKTKLPGYNDYDLVGKVFEAAFNDFRNERQHLSIDQIGSDCTHREALAVIVTHKMLEDSNILRAFEPFVQRREEEVGATPYNFAITTIDAFFDNDLFNSVKIFLSRASGSFGLCVTSSLDSHRQLCLASRGQTISVAFYPKKKIILFGSEQAAIKAAISVKFPGAKSNNDGISQYHLDVDKDVLRLDLDDLGGEICLLDWGSMQYATPPLSLPNREIQAQPTMNNRINVYLHSESKNFQTPYIHQRMTRLSDNPLITFLKDDVSDPVLGDIKDIPMICKSIQDDWHNTDDHRSTSSIFSLNRLTAWNLARTLRNRLEAYAAGSLVPSLNNVDILLTGCEVSLWLAEQFASDLRKAFPMLNVLALSSNKLVGLFGQDGINVPTVGFSTDEKTLNFNDTIKIIVSHSGGTFSPLACANLFQSFTDNIFVVTSEWDTQIGKQLRAMDENEGSGFKTRSRIFSTGVGVRPAEPCSLSVAATHQLLTNLFQFISTVILSNSSYCVITGAIVTERDLEILERCNKDNIFALESITGSKHDGTLLQQTKTKEKELRASGDIWSEHILENVKAYIMSFVYVVGTVVSGYPLVSGIAKVVGLVDTHGIFYLLRFFDALIYFFLPQINVIILRIIQGRALRHRMVGRTVVIGDIPWVAQAAEAFLSKIFACSYSIAGINVHSANPCDHLVHKMTHRVVRGSLLVCGRPDGRLAALTAMENSICLSINQASSIQSLGSTCESITIGHNKYKLPLSAGAIFLDRCRPLFLCEHLLAQRYGDENKSYSASALLGIYKTIENKNDAKDNNDVMGIGIESVIVKEINEKVWSSKLTRMFYSLDSDNDGQLNLKEFLAIVGDLKSGRSDAELTNIFHKFDKDDSGSLSFGEFCCIMSMDNMQIAAASIRSSARDENGFIQVKPSSESYFGASFFGGVETTFKDTIVSKHDSSAKKIETKSKDEGTGSIKSQKLAEELYESRIASLQRFVSMTVMFHQMGDRVERFFSKHTFGMMGYQKDRTHSIMRIATTASPISGADVRDRKREIYLTKKMYTSLDAIAVAWQEYKKKEKSN